MEITKFYKKPELAFLILKSASRHLDVYYFNMEAGVRQHEYFLSSYQIKFGTFNQPNH